MKINGIRPRFLLVKTSLSWKQQAKEFWKWEGDFEIKEEWGGDKKAILDKIKSFELKRSNQWEDSTRQ